MSALPPKWGSGLGARRRWTYAAVGFVLGFGAPLGLLLLRSLVLRTPPGRLLPNELASDGPLYLYLTVSTVLVFSAFGAVVGELHDVVRRSALADPLTGLPNRRHLELLLDNALARARRTPEELSILLVDVDELKRINDGGGHAAGDAALRAVGEALRSECRRSDLPARIGGDEFAVLVTGADATDAVALAERVRASLATWPGAPRVSIGVATQSRVGASDPRGLLAAADAALYLAKTTGRDRVVEAAPP
ncbi:MAG: GGDEF domain-containing protein [Pseudomonadota bacterium]|nr:GGDEF domain-containing protein [Pseudomonadota bacterium]